MTAEKYVQERLAQMLSDYDDNVLLESDHGQLQRLIELSILERLTNYLENNQVAVIVSQDGSWMVREAR